VSRPRLRRSDSSGPGLHRRRHGRGFAYTDAAGDRITDRAVLSRIAELTIPPAWQDVWICTDPQGHLQATGIDDAGRKQYLYHPRWHEQQGRRKFREMVDFAATLPALRRRIAADLQDEELGRARVLACAVRLLDLGLFRIGGEEYAEQGGGLGLATLTRQHVSVRDDTLVFDYPAKSGVRRVHSVRDAAAVEVIAALRRRRGGGGDTLLAYREGRRWRPLHSDDINGYIKQHLGQEFSAKDFRTWNATVLAAVALAAGTEPGTTKAARSRVIKGAVKVVAAELGNTPAVARRSYIDPRVFDRYLSGSTISVAPTAARRRLELAVLELLT
jgi:DNA topoisomerase I